LGAAGFSDAWLIGYMERVLDVAQRSIHREMKRGLGVLATVASTAPLMGMLGTVIGIAHAFSRSCGATPAVCMAVAANGIAEALMSTGFGLVVAVPALWSFNYFSERLERMDLEVENCGLELRSYLAVRVGRRGGQGRGGGGAGGRNRRGWGFRVFGWRALGPCSGSLRSARR
jgi:biopolymer transport protein ExbB/TolQ